MTTAIKNPNFPPPQILFQHPPPPPVPRLRRPTGVPSTTPPPYPSPPPSTPPPISDTNYVRTPPPWSIRGRRAPVYGLLLCGPHIPPAPRPIARIHTCGRANGACVICDGCFVRNETAPFFDQATLPGNVAVCGNRIYNAIGFAAQVQSLMADLSLATPRVDGFVVAAERGGVYEWLSA